MTTKVLGFVVSVVILVALMMILLMEPQAVATPQQMPEHFRNMLWNYRSLDVLGQMMVILAGTFGILVLVKERFER